MFKLVVNSMQNATLNPDKTATNSGTHSLATHFTKSLIFVPKVVKLNDGQI